MIYYYLNLEMFKKSLLNSFRFLSFDSVLKNVAPNCENQFIQINNPLLKLNSINSIPTINNLNDVIRKHAEKVYNGPRFSFNLIVLKFIF